MKKISIITVLLISLMLVATSISFADTPVVTEDKIVSTVSVKKVNKKFTFMKVVDFTTTTPKQEQYEIEDEWWRGTDGSEIYKGGSGKAKSGKLSYSYFVELSAKEGYIFNKSTRITVNGKKSNVVPVVRDKGKTAIFKKVITGVTTDHYVVLPKGVKQKGQDRVSINNVTQKIILGGCRKSTVTFVKGKHTIDTSIIVPNNTTINARGATIKQKTKGKPIFVNYLYKNSKYNKGKKKKIGKYNRCYNITINGGTYIVTGKPAKKAKKGKFGKYKAGYSNFMFMHGKNITVKNCTIKNNYNGHFIEFAGIKNGKISHVKLAGKYKGDSTNEAIQLDTCMNESVSPQGAPWDGTANQNITITKCKISVPRMPVGIGMNSKAKKKHRNIKIINNKIKVKGSPVSLNNVKKVTVKKSGKVKVGKGVSGYKH